MAFCTGNCLDRVDLQKKWLLQRAWSEQYESWDSAKTIAGAVVPDGTTIVSKKAYLECLGKIPANRFFECASSHHVGKP